MFKNTMLFNYFKLNCLKTQGFSMIPTSNVENTMLFNDLQLKCLKTQCVSMI